MVVSRTLRCDDGFMTSREFISERGSMLARRDNPSALTRLTARAVTAESIVRVRFTTVERGELRKGVLAAMLRQLNIARREF